MKIIRQDIWKYLTEGWCVVIPTNSHVNANGIAAMSDSIAHQAKFLFKNLSLTLGNLIKTQGSKVFVLERQRLICFPTKEYWKDDSSLEIIEKSCEQLVTYMKALPNIKVAMPKVGCGFGNLKWDDVASVIQKYFGGFSEDRFVIVDNEQGKTRFWKGDNV